MAPSKSLPKRLFYALKYYIAWSYTFTISWIPGWITDHPCLPHHDDTRWTQPQATSWPSSRVELPRQAVASERTQKGVRRHQGTQDGCSTIQ